MNMKLSTNRRFKRMFANILRSVVILTMIFANTGFSVGAAEPASAGDWDVSFVRKAGVLQEADGYKMWYDGADLSGHPQVGLATSSDGLTWMKHSGNPVLSGGPDEWDASSEEHSPFVMKDGNTYKMWYEGSNGTVRQLGYATSPDGITWTKYAGNPVLQAGPEAYDQDVAGHGSILYEDGIYKLWYHAIGDQGAIIAYATSADGVNWTKQGPVLLPEGWEVNLWGPSVLKVNGAYWMWYSAGGEIYSPSIGVATSTDGIVWTRVGPEPVIKDPDGEALGDPHVIQDGGIFKMWFNNFDEGTIYYAESEDGLAWTVPTPVLFPSPNPWFTAFPAQEAVEGWDWPLGATLHLTIDDPNTEASPDHEQDGTVILAPWGSGQHWVWFDFAGVYDMKPGDEVTLTDGSKTRTHTVQNLTVSGVDESADTVSGTADPGATVNVWPHEAGESVQHVTVAEDGTWLASFSGVFNLKAGTAGRAEVLGAEGNATAVDWWIPNPRFVVFPEGEWFDGNDWPDGATVTITVEGKTECATSKQSSGNFFNGGFPAGCDIVVGDTVTFTDGDTVRTHTVRNLAITDVNKEANTVDGTADVGEIVYVWPHATGQQLQATVGASGIWQVDFTDVFDLVEGTDGRSEIRDEEGNSTAVDWRIPNPHFTAFPEWESIEGWEWPDGAVVHLTIDDPATAESPDYSQDKSVEPTPWDPNQLWVQFNFVNTYDMKPGDIVTLDDGETPRTHTVRNLAITAVDMEADTVAGTADPGEKMFVWPHGFGQYEVQPTSGGDGTWLADFRAVGFDLKLGVNGRVEIRDGQGNATGVDWSTPPAPYIEAFAWFDRFSLAEWPAGNPVEITVEDPDTALSPDYQETFTPDGSTNWYNFFPGIDLKPGVVISATSVDASKTLVISKLAGTDVDPIAGAVSGIATPNRIFHMRTDGDHFQLPIEQDIATDSAGDWSVTIGEYTPWEWFTRGEMWESDDDGDVTYSIWHVHNELVEVWLAQNEIRAFDWPRDAELTFYVDGTEIATAVTQPQEWMDGTAAVVNAGDLQLVPGMTVTVTDGSTEESTVIQDIKITHANPEDDVVYGYAPANASIELVSREDSPQIRFFNADASGNWTVDYRIPSVNGVTVDVNLGDTFTLLMREPDKDSTVYEWSVSNPHIWADPICECVNGWEWNAGDTITIRVFDQDGNEFALQNPSQVYAPDAGVFFDLNPEGIDLQPGYRIVMTNGDITKEVVVTKLEITKFDIPASMISGIYDPAFALDINVRDQERLSLEVDGDQWVATFSDLPLSAGGEAWQTDEDGDQTGFGWDSIPTFTLYDIYTYNASTRAVKRITKLENAGEFNPSWSPNGLYIAHDVVTGDSVMVPNSQDIYVTNIATGKSLPLKGAEGGNDAAWSPNGLWIAFDRRWAADDLGVYVVPFTGGQRRLVRENVVSADWAPNGLRLVIQDLADNGKVKTIGLFGHAEYTVADYGDSPAWSPDGNWIAYQKDGDIWKVRVTSLGVPLGKPIQVTKDGADEGHPTWSADSKTIVYSSAMGSDYDLWKVPAAGGMGTWLNGVPEFGDYDPDYWKNSIAYESVSPDSQIARLWVSAFTYDPPVGLFPAGTHPYHFKVKWSLPTPGEWEGQGGELVISGDAPLYDGRVLLRGPEELKGVFTPDELICEGVDAVNPKQRMRFLFGWATDSEMTYPEATAHFKSMIGKVLGDGASATLVRNEIHPFTSSEDWFQYVCTYTMRK